MSPCPICQSPERPLFTARLLSKYEVTYYFCDHCGFLHTEKPYWLSEAYSDAIAASDTGIVRRNLDASAKTAALFTWMFAGNGRYLDVAGGYGLFTRMMRDLGFDYFWSDPYASNCFARGFEADLSVIEPYRAATAFEALEHMENPLAFLQSILAAGRCEALLFSTELYAGAEPPRSWPYYSCHSGQHIAFFHRRTLEFLAESLGMHLCTTASFHLLSRTPVNPLVFRLLTSRASAKISQLLFAVTKRPRIAGDNELMVERSSRA